MKNKQEHPSKRNKARYDRLSNENYIWEVWYEHEEEPNKGNHSLLSTRSAASLSTPTSINSRTQSVWPLIAAQISAVRPPCESDPPPHAHSAQSHRKQDGKTSKTKVNQQLHKKGFNCYKEDRKKTNALGATYGQKARKITWCADNRRKLKNYQITIKSHQLSTILSNHINRHINYQITSMLTSNVR